MRLGYPCINTSVGCTASSTFRLRSYSPERLEAAVAGNLACLLRTLRYNADMGFLFFRIGSQLVPFASHPVCRYGWEGRFQAEFRHIGRFIRSHGMRVSMHPDQFVLLNSPDAGVTERSVRELEYHCRVLDLMGLGRAAKVQIHVGGVYGDKPAAIERFCGQFRRLDAGIRRRIAIENDHRLFSLKDCIGVHRQTGVPVVFDSFHHECLNSGETTREAAMLAAGCWKPADGPPMVDYSSQEGGALRGTHARTINAAHFRRFIREMAGLDFDVMLEIKDKEKSAAEALAELRRMRRGSSGKPVLDL